MGLLVFENKLKKESKGIISALQEAQIQSHILTGDNVMTAVKVAIDLGIVKGHQVVVCDYVEG